MGRLTYQLNDECHHSFQWPALWRTPGAPIAFLVEEPAVFFSLDAQVLIPRTQAVFTIEAISSHSRCGHAKMEDTAVPAISEGAAVMQLQDQDIGHSPAQHMLLSPHSCSCSRPALQISLKQQYVSTSSPDPSSQAPFVAPTFQTQPDSKSINTATVQLASRTPEPLALHARCTPDPSFMAAWCIPASDISSLTRARQCPRPLSHCHLSSTAAP